jgi:flavin-dependent dehydrogenase
VADSASNARHLLDEFLKERGLRPIAYQGAVIPLHHPARQIEWRRGDSRVLLVGDAAAHVKVTTVGGLVSGLWGANAAAQSIIKGTSYAAELGALHRELYLHDLIRWIVDRFEDKDYDRLLTALNDPLARLLSHHNRDSMASVFAMMLMAQPALLFMAAKAILVPYRQSSPPSRSIVTAVPVEME